MKGYKYNAKVILSAMAKKSMTVDKLAKESGVSSSTIINILNRKNQAIYLHTALKLAKTLELDVNDIIEI